MKVWVSLYPLHRFKGGVQIRRSGNRVGHGFSQFGQAVSSLIG